MCEKLPSACDSLWAKRPYFAQIDLKEITDIYIYIYGYSCSF
ncbi:hypothetical protein NC651_028829 [Populus alba x Populus x berolinensis]|uniref:Uncharacterized protein n=1 Tax=Populus alba x Populus x berolinensis TaxID=444605 RepID=A0AAD6M2E7_9ROSI|nr:hypothetical protein NC651_028829 [Populus alba x Populus x berolinensis]KAJ6977590.1 hypothetical protein NC653_029477 [Populus alba x Populus x berolinensis]